MNELNMIAAIAVVSLLAGNALRAWQMGQFVTVHLTQQPPTQPTGSQVVFIDTSLCFYCWDLIQNDPELNADVIRLSSHGTQRNTALVAQFWPGYERVITAQYGEVYAPPALRAH